MDDVLGIAKYNNGIYGIRGIGPSYDSLYCGYLGNMDYFMFRYVCVHSDWPWDYIKFNEEEDREYFESIPLVKKFIYDMNEDFLI